MKIYACDGGRSSQSGQFDLPQGQLLNLTNSASDCATSSNKAHHGLIQTLERAGEGDICVHRGTVCEKGAGMLTWNKMEIGVSWRAQAMALKLISEQGPGGRAAALLCVRETARINHGTNRAQLGGKRHQARP